MPDITMCEGKDCPLKEKCLRFKSIPSEFRQSYFLETPYINGNCSHFLEIHERKAKIYNEQTSKN